MGRSAVVAVAAAVAATAAAVGVGAVLHDPGPAPVPGAAPQDAADAYTTGYTWFDNTPPGSAVVSHPVLHREAGGTGTYADPVTLAVGHSLATGDDVLDHPPGTRFYLPHVRRYFVVEDTCGDGPAPQDGPCHDLDAAPSGTGMWLDLWVGGGPGDDPAAVQACAGTVTDGDAVLHEAVEDPAPTYPVVPGPLFQDGRCTALYPGPATAR